MKHFDFRDGLSNNSIMSLFQDKSGSVWLGTYDGLNKFDGFEYKVYKNEIGNDKSLPTNSIYTINEDNQNNLWVGSRQGISIFNPRTTCFSHVDIYHPTKGRIPLGCNIHEIIHLKNGDMAAASEDWGLIVFGKDSPVGKPVAIKYKDQITCAYDAKGIVEDTLQNTLWFFVENKGLFCVKTDHRKAVATLQCSVLTAASTLVLDKNTVWLGNMDGLFRYDITRKAFSRNYFTQRTAVTSLTISENRLWIGTDGQGLFSRILDDTSYAVVPFKETSKLYSNSIFSLMRDRNNQLWVGTLRAGFSILYKENACYSLVKVPESLHSLADNFIFTFCEDAKNNVWIGTDGAGLKYWNREKNTFSTYRRETGAINSNFVTGIRIAEKDNVWLSTWFAGISKFNTISGKYQPYTLYNKGKNRIEKNAWFLFTDSQDRLWTSTSNNGTLYQYNAQLDSFLVFDARIENIQTMQEDDEGNLWAGGYKHLILLDNKNKQHKYFRIHYTVRSIQDDHNGYLWVGTEGGGLLVIRKKTMAYKRYTVLDGLPDNAILRLLPDTYGNIWISTFSGLACMGIASREVKRLPINNNEKRNQFSYHAAVALKDGALLFGGINGISMVHPSMDFTNASNKYPISLTGMRVNGSPDISTYIVNESVGRLQLKIPYAKNSIAFSFSSPEFLNPEQIQYSHRLKNWDIDWSRPSGMRNVSYSKLPPGIYTLEVRNTDANNKWSDTASLVTLTVLSPWYATWWAYALYLLIFIGLISLYIGYVKYRQQMHYELQIAHIESQQEKERNKKKISFFTHISHELRTPLTLIINPLKTILKNAGTTDPIDVGSLSVAYKNARRLLALMDQLLLFRKADENADTLNCTRFAVSALIRDVCHCFDSQAKEKQIAFTWETPFTEQDNVWADKQKLEIILFNLLSNSFKYTGKGGKITVSCTVNQEQSCTVKVVDNGTGIPSDVGNQIFEKFKQTSQSKNGFGIGLYLVKHFAEMHGGSVRYTSSLGKRTEFIVQLPIVDKGEITAPPRFSPTENEDGTVHGVGLADILEETPLPGQTPSPKSDRIGLDEIISPKKKILVVEDEKQMRTYLAQLFEPDYIVCTAANGEDAYSILEKEMPDLVISDIQMDKMDGIALCKAIKNTEKTAHIPIILLTSSASEEIQIDSMNAGADNYVVKPFDNEVLKTKIKGILDNRTKLQQYFFNKITLKDNHQDNSRIPQEYQEFVQQCIHIVESNLEDEDFDIKKFCQEIGMSHSALYKKVKNVSGQTINKFIRSIRLRRAAVMMLKENYSVNQAAFQVGIGDVKYFREQFRVLFGMNPSEYIKKYRSSFSGVYHKVLRKEKDVEENE